jgi:uncharacterized membrane protein
LNLHVREFIKKIRGNIVAGVLLLIPSITTIYVFTKLFGLVDSILPNLSHMIFPFLPEKWGIPGIGVVVILIFSYFVGLAAKNYFGRMIIDTGNAIISRIPMLNKIYLGVQQVIDSVAGHKKNLFDKAVLIEYPKKDSYCIGFITSETTGEIPEKTKSEMVSIFVPTTPNPTSGFLLFLPKSEVIELEMSVETAIKLVMSAGMVSTDHLKQTNHMYALPKQLKNFNWTKIFARERPPAGLDPRD